MDIIYNNKYLIGFPLEGKRTEYPKQLEIC